MKGFYAVIFILFLLWGCSGSVDTSLLSPDEHFKYALELYNDEDYEESLKEFQSLLLQYPGSAINDDSQYYLGMTHFKRGEYLLAAYEYSKLIRDIPASSFVPDAQFMLAESYYNLSPNFQLDQSYTKKAIQEFQAFLDFFPANPKVEEAEKKIKELNEKLAEKEFKSAEIYEKMDYSRAAIKYYQNVVEIYHDTEYAPIALYRKIKLLLSKDRYTEASRDINHYLSKYPNGEHIEELKKTQEELSSDFPI